MGEFSFLDIVGIIAVLVGTVVALLRTIAPKTANTIDDKALDIAEDVQEVVNRVSSED